MSELSKQALKVDNNQSFPNNNNGAITPSILRAFNVNMIDSNVNQTDFDTFSGSVANEFASLTASVDPSITGSSLVTASFDNGTRNLTFTKGDATTFAVNIPDVSGSTINTASFATTGSNTFYGNQIISGNITPLVNFGGELGASDKKWTRLYTNEINGLSNLSVDAIRFTNTDFPIQFAQARQVFANGSDGPDVGVYYLTSSANVNAVRQLAYVVSGSGNNPDLGQVSASFAATIAGIVVGSGSAISVQDEGTILGNATSFNFNGAGVTATVSAGTASITIPGGGGSIDTGSFAITGSNTFRGDQNISGSIFFPNGTEVRGNASQQTSLYSPTSSLLLGSVVNMTISSSNLLIESPRTDIRGVETIGDMSGTGFGEVYLLGRSGSLIIGNSVNGPTYAGLSHISSSQINGNTNLIFKNNSNTGELILSGSGNIFSNPLSPAAGRSNYLTNNNIILNAGGFPQITGSAATVSGNRPNVSQNIFGATIVPLIINQSVNPGAHNYSNNMWPTGQVTVNALGNTGPITMTGNFGNVNAAINAPSRSIAQVNAGESGSNSFTMNNNMSTSGLIQYNGPVSSSLHQINNNAVIGQLTLNVQSSSRAVTFSNNNVAGQLLFTDNTVFAPTLGSVTSITNNIVAGNTQLINRASSSFQVSNNNFTGWNINNDFDASSITSGNFRFLGIANNALFGGTFNNIYASGSNGALNNQRAITNNLLGGQFISASVVANGSDSNLFGTIGFGNDLNVVGTSRRDASTLTSGAGATIGSAFFGRYNKLGQGFNTTAEVILAVGTGTSGSAGVVRKTGFLIDSGSNAFFEGTLNVSGSTSTTGSITIQSGSGDLFVHGNKQFNVGTFYSTVTQSGSAAVSQSMTFNTTDISEGITMVAETQFTFANSGVYNIQFSAQLLADTGADDIYIWLKKNGTNVPDTAGRLLLSNNEEAMASWNYVVSAVANDYYELCWQSTNGDAVLLYNTATGNIPAVPSVIATVTQVR